MLFEYIHKALEKARYKQLEDKSWFSEITGFKGVWANGRTVEECRKELSEVLEEWLLLKIRDGDSIPQIKQFKIRIREVANIVRLTVLDIWMSLRGASATKQSPSKHRDCHAPPAFAGVARKGGDVRNKILGICT